MKDEIIVIGAGSTGLSSAVFLDDKGYKVKIYEKRARTKISKAIAINPNTLSIFEKFGITQKFIENGKKLEGFCLWYKEELLLNASYSSVNHKYPYMIIQPQYETEEILEDYLKKKNILVEREIEFKELETQNNTILLNLYDTKQDLHFQKKTNNIVIGADGNKSQVRTSVKIEQIGWEHKETYCVYDAELECNLSKDKAHMIFHKEGTVLLINIRGNVWRIGGNLTNSIDNLPKGTMVKNVIWKSEFTIQDKLVKKMNQNNVFILGDAAHIHSPVGGKGMNLCIEDSYILAEALSNNKQSEFSTKRLKKLRKNVSTLSRVTELFGGKHFIGNNIRSQVKNFKFLLPFIAPKMINFILDIEE